MIFCGAHPGMGRQSCEMEEARRSYDDSHYDHARDDYKRMSVAGSREHADEVAYGLGATNFKLGYEPRIEVSVMP